MLVDIGDVGLPKLTLIHHDQWLYILWCLLSNRAIVCRLHAQVALVLVRTASLVLLMLEHVFIQVASNSA